LLLSILLFFSFINAIISSPLQPFVSSKFWKKLHYIEIATDLFRDVHFRGRQLALPEYVIRYRIPKRRVFGTPIEEAMIETPQGFLLPPVLEMTIFHLCAEGLSRLLSPLNLIYF
jgi:hypothetical protein